MLDVVHLEFFFKLIIWIMMFSNPLRYVLNLLLTQGNGLSDISGLITSNSSSLFTHISAAQNTSDLLVSVASEVI